MATAKKKAAKASAEQAPRTTWTRAEAEAHIRQTVGRCLGPRDPEKYAQWQRLMDQGKTEEARQISTRTGCGYDFAETVLAHPFDGQEREVVCPKCGVTTSYRAPVFDGLDETKKAKR